MHSKNGGSAPKEHLNSPTSISGRHSGDMESALKEHLTSPISISGVHSDSVSSLSNDPSTNNNAGNPPALTIESNGSIQSSMDRGQQGSS